MPDPEHSPTAEQGALEPETAAGYVTVGDTAAAEDTAPEDGEPALPQRRFSGGRLATLVAASSGFIVIAVTAILILVVPTDEERAIDACEEAVLDQLKAPATAEFVGAPTTEQTESGGFIVKGEVDAENGFGAFIRGDYLCSVVPSGDTWFALAVLM